MMLPVKYFSNDEVADIISVSECIEIVEDLFKDVFIDAKISPSICSETSSNILKILK